MKNIEFAEKYGTIHNWVTDNKEFINLYDYQKTLLTEFENNRFIAGISSRQMGISSMLIFHLSNWIINNKTDKNCFYIMSNNRDSSRDMLNKIKIIIGNYKMLTVEYYDMKKLEYITNNINEIELNNGNIIKIISSFRGVDLTNKNLIIDNASFMDNEIMQTISNINFNFSPINQYIMFSSFKEEYNTFYDEIFLKENIFKKIKIKWDQNPNYTQEWYNNLKKSFYKQNMSEIDLVRKNEPIKEKINKNRIINIRLDDDMINKISHKLIEKDLSLSEYIRMLIKKDV